MKTQFLILLHEQIFPLFSRALSSESENLDLFPADNMFFINTATYLAILASFLSTTLAAPAPTQLNIDISITNDGTGSTLSGVGTSKDPEGWYCPRPGTPYLLLCDDDQVIPDP